MRSLQRKDQLAVAGRKFMAEGAAISSSGGISQAAAREIWVLHVSRKALNGQMTLGVHGSDRQGICPESTSVSRAREDQGRAPLSHTATGSSSALLT